MKLADKIMNLRKQKGMSQEELANVFDISRQAVFKWESGEAIPDIGKLKKMALYFNVSLDVLLDDKKDITYNTSNMSRMSYRDVYVSENVLDPEQADIDHDYINNGKARKDKYDVNQVFKDNLKRFESVTNASQYSKVIYLQPDLLCYFFIDDNNKTIGFVFDDAEQFVCPFENFIDLTITHTASGGFKGTSGENDMHTLTISYYDKDGNANSYDIKVQSAVRVYIFNNVLDKSPNVKAYCAQIRRSTLNNLAEIQNALNLLKANLANKSLTNLPAIDILTKAEAVKRGQTNKQIRITKLEEVAAEFKKKKRKKWIIIGAIIIVVIIIIGVIANFIPPSETPPNA